MNRWVRRESVLILSVRFWCPDAHSDRSARYKRLRIWKRTTATRARISPVDGFRVSMNERRSSHVADGPIQAGVDSLGVLFGSFEVLSRRHDIQTGR